jgi:hypothetical protein
MTLIQSVNFELNITTELLLSYTLVAFEPGASALQADAMTTAPRRQGLLLRIVAYVGCENLRLLLKKLAIFFPASFRL